MGIWKDAILLTLLGMGVVYAGLAFLMWVIMALNRLFPVREGAAPGKKAGGAEEDELSPLVAAAVAHYLEGERPPLFVAPARREDGTHWAREGRVPGPFERGREGARGRPGPARA